MASDPKSTPGPSPIPAPRADVKGIRIFTYPKVIYIFPTLIVSLICGIGMKMIDNRTEDPSRVPIAERQNVKAAAASPAPVSATPPLVAKHERFKAAQNIFGVLFLGVF